MNIIECQIDQKNMNSNSTETLFDQTLV